MSMNATDNYLVWNPQHGMPTMRHASFDLAKAEAERLAHANPGQVFLVMKPAGYARIEKPSIYTPLDSDDFIPF